MLGNGCRVNGNDMRVWIVSYLGHKKENFFWGKGVVILRFGWYIWWILEISAAKNDRKDSNGSYLNGQIQALVDMLVAEEGISLGSIL